MEATPVETPNSRELILISRIRQLFTDVNAAAILSDKWLRRRAASGRAAMGFCYVSAWTVFELLGGRQAGLRVKRTETGDEGHFWVEDASGRIIDPTADQFVGPFDYSRGYEREACSDPGRVAIFRNLLDAAFGWGRWWPGEDSRESWIETSEKSSVGITGKTAIERRRLLLETLQKEASEESRVNLRAEMEDLVKLASLEESLRAAGAAVQARVADVRTAEDALRAAQKEFSGLLGERQALLDSHGANCRQCGEKKPGHGRIFLDFEMAECPTCTGKDLEDCERFPYPAD